MSLGVTLKLNMPPFPLKSNGAIDVGPHVVSALVTAKWECCKRCKHFKHASHWHVVSFLFVCVHNDMNESSCYYNVYSVPYKWHENNTAL